MRHKLVSLVVTNLNTRKHTIKIYHLPRCMLVLTLIEVLTISLNKHKIEVLTISLNKHKITLSVCYFLCERLIIIFVKIICLLSYLILKENGNEINHMVHKKNLPFYRWGYVFYLLYTFLKFISEMHYYTFSGIQ